MDQNQIAKMLKSAKVDALLVTNPINIFYLTGFKGISPTEREALLVVKKDRSTLITAKLYQAEAKKLKSKTLDVKIAAERNEYKNYIKESFANVKNLGFEEHSLTFAEHRKFRKYFKGKFTPTKNLIDNLRSLKSTSEIENIEKAQLITQKVFNELVKTVKAGQSEQEISQRLKSITRRFTHQGQAFEPIIASGPNSALPHHQAGRRKIKKGDALLFDFGTKYKNYCADFARTIFIAKASDTQRNTFDLVLKTQQTVISRIKPGILAKTIHKAASSIFKKQKVENHFIHSLGHGIGLEIHEKPSISKKSKDTLKEGMVFSVEPGLYFSWGGVRIEDLITIKKNKARVMGARAQAQFIEI